jgi:hypothetical protein
MRLVAFALLAAAGAAAAQEQQKPPAEPAEPAAVAEFAEPDQLAAHQRDDRRDAQQPPGGDRDGAGLVRPQPVQQVRRVPPLLCHGPPERT